MDVVATARYVRQSPRKVRLVTSSVSKMPPVEAVDALQMMQVRAAKVVADVLQSAIANATNNFKLQPSSLRIRTLEVGEGPTLKRMQAASRGRGHSIFKRTSHVRVVLTDEPAVEKRPASSAKGPGKQQAPQKTEKPETRKRQLRGNAAPETRVEEKESKE